MSEIYTTLTNLVVKATDVRRRYPHHCGMAHKRRDDPSGRYFGAERVVMARGQWFVMTRERMDVGPYETREAAEIAANELTDALDGIDEPDVVLALIKEFIRRRTPPD